MVDRTPRDQDTRERTARKKTWVRPSALATPNPKDGVHFRYVRTSTQGQSDSPNVSARFREGYVPVRADDHPEIMALPDHDSKFEGNIESGGLLLCAIDKDISDDRIKQQLAQADSQMASVDNSYLKQSDPRMPVLKPDRSTRTSFGEG